MGEELGGGQKRAEKPPPQELGSGSLHPAGGVGVLESEELGDRRLILEGGALPSCVSELLPSGCAFPEGWRAQGWLDPSGQWEALEPGGGGGGRERVAE